jgi:hypothetical protein
VLVVVVVAEGGIERGLDGSIVCFAESEWEVWFWSCVTGFADGVGVFKRRED